MRNALCAQDVSPDVRQSAFALVGDLAKAAAGHLAPVVPDLLALGIANLQPAMLRAETMSACNNACWSLGAPPLSGPPAAALLLARVCACANPAHPIPLLHVCCLGWGCQRCLFSSLPGRH